MADERDPRESTSSSEERLRGMKSSKKGASALSFAWLPVVLIVAAVGLLFWWLTQTIQPDRERALGTPPAIAVGTAPARGSSAAVATPAPAAGLAVSDVLKNRQRYGSERISVAGRYRARDARGELKGQAAVTANDWVLSDGTSALWVTGRPPADLSLSGEKDVDTPLVVEGVLRDVGGKAVLDATSVIVAGRAPVAQGVATASAGATVPASGTPAAGGAAGAKGIQPGVYVKVAGTEGSQLSYRSGPGANNARVTEQPLLPDGTRLKVLEGPTRDSDGKNWWRLQSDKGVIGWAVEDFLQTTEGP